MYSFNYHRAQSIDEARDMYSSGQDPVYLAGGMTLIPSIKQRLSSPNEVIDLGAIDSMKGTLTSGTSIRIGGLTTHSEVASTSTIAALAALAGGIGDPQVRNRGTIGGSIANNDPAADYPAALVGLGATVFTNDRSIPADDFFTGMFETSLADGEIVTSVEFPMPTRAAYVKFPNPASRYAIVGVMVAETGGEVRVAVTGAGPYAFRMTEMESALSSNFAPSAVADTRVDHSDFNVDLHASSEYRAHLVRTMAQRAVAQIA
ncbi:MAG: xanthine dehydrogenase family protein subunit M [Gammaproteobacteria bacterium]|nr:xanthine dehydrogenase family protein subunit M [Gammaproteobacteria bacterium]